MWTLEDIADKKDYEGGWYEFLNWGKLGPEEVPEEIRDQWAYLIEAFHNFEEITNAIDQHLPDPGIF